MPAYESADTDTTLVRETVQSGEAQQEEVTVRQETRQEETVQPQKEGISDQQETQQPEESSQAFRDTDQGNELLAWLEEKMSQRESVTDKERKKWGKVKEEDFFPVWQEIVLQEVNARTDDYDSIVICMEWAETLYGEIYGFDQTRISEIKSLVGNMSDALKENKTLRSKYGGDLEELCLTYQIEDFYITQRLEQGYSDNVLGKLQKEYDSYQSQDSSDWVAYDVEYVGDTPTAGDTFRIIHADSLNPFTQRGVYEVAYYDTGKMRTISSSGGFKQDVPEYQMIGNLAAFWDDVNLYDANLSDCIDQYNVLRQALGGEELAVEGQAEGDYYLGSWVDVNNEWLYMEISSIDGIHYQIDISDRLGSAEFATWSFEGVYDASLLGLVYSDGERWDIDQMEETLVYSDGSGALIRGEGRSFYWQDDKDNYGEFCCFVPAGD
ncbi:MAG: hypothetical protein NC489_44680, partial [Ruminococcus flavefaciens]|nr:hypothetical protein [Ruminococcus flavefaciens]